MFYTFVYTFSEVYVTLHIIFEGISH